MTSKKELVDRMVERASLNGGTRLSRRGAQQLVDGLFRDIEEITADGTLLTVHGFGTFYTKRCEERSWYVAAKGKRYQTPEGTRVKMRSRLKANPF